MLADIPAAGADDTERPTIRDPKTTPKDCAHVGIHFADGRGRQAGFHTLRHTLSTLRYEIGCSDPAVTDGYPNARLGDMPDALAVGRWAAFGYRAWHGNERRPHTGPTSETQRRPATDADWR